jgi:prefoldin subunit 5
MQSLSQTRDILEEQLKSSEKIHLQLQHVIKQCQFVEQWFEHLQRTMGTLLTEQISPIDDKLVRMREMRRELNKREEMIHQWLRTSTFVRPVCQPLLGQIERFQVHLTLTLKDYEKQEREENDVRQRVQILSDWIKEQTTHRVEPPFSEKRRDLNSLQREHERLAQQRQSIEEKSHEIESIRRTMNRFVVFHCPSPSLLDTTLSFSSHLLSNHSLQRLRQQISQLKERFVESNTELEMRSKFLNKSIEVRLQPSFSALHVDRRFSGD